MTLEALLLFFKNDQKTKKEEKNIQLVKTRMSLWTKQIEAKWPHLLSSLKYSTGFLFDEYIIFADD